MNGWRCWAVAVIARFILIFYAAYHDSVSSIKYTDVDYMVFTDAAHFVAVGQSPYLRSTYRYTPVLTFLLLPTQWMHKDFGKWLFCACDLLTAYFIALILRRLKVSSTSINWMTYLWILNPFVIGISTRGSAESLVCLFCVMTAWLVISNRLFMAAIVFGFVVHLKIYPIIYVVPILCYLGHKELASDTRQQKVEMTRNHSLHLSAHLSPPTSSIYVKHLNELGIMRLMYNKQIWVFALVSAGTFFALGALMTAMYGVEFIQHTYLYHLSRKDHRHNFSIYHLPIYILFHHPSASILSLSAFIPQLISTVVLGLAFKSNLIFAMFTQTFAFVALNKVITSQYFMWYLCFLPLILPHSDLYTQQKWRTGLWMILAWLLPQALWLSQAVRLEMMGEDTFVMLWLSSLLFFAANVAILVTLIRNLNYSIKQS